MSTEATQTPEATTAQTTETPQTPAAPEAPEAPAQAAPEQATPPPPPEPPPLPPRAAEALKGMLQKESELRKQAEELKQREAKIREEATAEYRKKLKEDPLSLLASEGLSLSELAKRHVEMTTKANDPLAPVKTEIQQLREHLAAKERAEQEAKREAALAEVQREVQQYVDSSTEFPLIKAAGAQQAVFQTMLDHYQQTGEAISEAVAAKKVEEQLQAFAAKLTAVVGKPSEAPAGQVKQPPPTLTNNLSTNNPTRVAKPMTYEEELAEMKRVLRFRE